MFDTSKKEIDNLNNVVALDIEKNVLAILFNSEDARNTALQRIKREDFSSEIHQEIFVSILALAQKNDEVFTLHLLADHLAERKKLNFIGGYQYLAELTVLFVSAGFLENYLNILIKNSTNFKIKKMISAIEAFAAKTAKPDKSLNFIHQHLNDLEDFYYRDKKKFQFLPDVIDKIVEKWEDFHYSPNNIKCSTGFQILDNKINGFQKGDLIILAARPSMGKTSLLLNIALNSAVFQPKTRDREDGDIIIFSLEMSAHQLVQRIVKASIPHLNLQNIQVQDFNDIKSFSQKLADNNIYIDTSMNLDVLKMHFKLRSWAKKRKIKLVILDYLQLLKPLSQRFENRNLEVSYWTRQLKETARELDIPVICASQLSRNVEKREDKRPLLADLRDSGSIEQDADLVLFLYRESYYQKKILKNDDKTLISQRDNNLVPHNAEIIISKHRNGPTGIIKLLFVPEKTSFYEVVDN